jgi:hypothetical protein
MKHANSRHSDKEISTHYRGRSYFIQYIEILGEEEVGGRMRVREVPCVIYLVCSTIRFTVTRHVYSNFKHNSLNCLLELRTSFGGLVVLTR